ncbi:MAG: hypothetical protein JWN37_13 [Candidatus Nomurabacteria bacterium]|nr:hypothetical protein [Candidatus Nomurabacteria bacterium]
MYTDLFNFIKDKIYEQEKINEVSLNSSDRPGGLFFNFKNQSLAKDFLKEYSESFWKEFKDKYNRVQVGGMESGALPLIACLSIFAPDNVCVTGFYVRKSRKKDGLGNLIEGELNKSDPIILVDDILNSGSTIKKQIKILEEQGYRVSSVFVCLRYRDLSFYKDLTDSGINVVSIFDLNDFSDVLPVKNIKLSERILYDEKYIFQYKVTLTNKPNLYVVVPKSAPLLKDNYIYMGADDGNFFCLNKENGGVVWKYKILFGSKGKRILSSPNIYKNKVIFGAYDGNVYCLDRLLGKREWVFSDADWVGSSPCIDYESGIVFIGLEFGLIEKKGGVVAIDINSGKEKWKYYSMLGQTHASPSYNKKYNMVICGCNDGFIYSFNAESGEVLWKFKTKGEIKYGAIFNESMGQVIIASLDGGVYILSVKYGSLYYRFEGMFGFYSTPVLTDNKIIIGCLDKKVYCFNIITKETEWQFETGGRVFSSPIIDGESVFVGSNDGVLYELDIKTGVKVSIVRLTERIVNKIEIERDSQGKRILYIPTHVSELYKYVEGAI